MTRFNREYRRNLDFSIDDFRIPGKEVLHFFRDKNIFTAVVVRGHRAEIIMIEIPSGDPSNFPMFFIKSSLQSFLV